MLEHSKTEFEIGIDECGRGCLAGPVVASAVVWNPVWLADNPTEPILSIIKDSKKLSPKKRKMCEMFIKKHAHAWTVSFVDSDIIDRKNIIEATYDAMHNCLDGMFEQKPGFKGRLLVDGNRFRPYDNIQLSDVKCVVGGDNVHLCIASASILAKVARDEYMDRMSDTMNDIYGWTKNKGYGTQEHLRAIEKHGVCDMHRKTFRRCY